MAHKLFLFLFLIPALSLRHAKLKLLAPEGVNIIRKENGKRFYKLQWRNLVDEGEEDDQDLPF